MSYFSQVKVKDSTDTVINPATKDQIGEVQASPTQYTVLDRLKALLTGIVLAAGNATIGKVGIDQTTDGTTNAVALRGVTTGSTYKPLRLDLATETAMTIDYPHHEVHAGSHYYNEFSVDIPASDVLDIRWTTPNTTKWFHFILALQSQEECQITLYEVAPILTAGTSLTAFNSNRNSTNTSGITGFDYIVNADLADANADTDISGATAIRGPYMIGSNQGNIEGRNRNDDEIILKQNTAYCLRCENLVASARYLTWLFNWYEHTDRS